MKHASAAHLRLPIAVGLTCVLCGLSGADLARSDRDAYETARLRIEKMPAEVRERLKASFQEFRRLPVDKQEEYKKLHTDLQAEPKLQEVMQKYCDWLVTLEPSQQIELQNEKKIAKKVSLVKEFRKQQANERTTHDLNELFGPLARLPVLSIEQLNDVMTKLESQVLPETALKSEEKQKLATLHGPQRQSYVLALVVDRDINRIGLPQRLPLDVIDRIREFIGGKLTPVQQREFNDKPAVSKLLVLTIVAKSLEEQIKSPPPSQSELEKVFENLKPTDRDEIMRLRPDEGQRRLEEVHHESHPELYPLETIRRFMRYLRENQPRRPNALQPTDVNRWADLRPRNGISTRPPSTPPRDSKKRLDTAQ